MSVVNWTTGQSNSPGCDATKTPEHVVVFVTRAFSVGRSSTTWYGKSTASRPRKRSRRARRASVASASEQDRCRLRAPTVVRPRALTDHQSAVQSKKDSSTGRERCTCLPSFGRHRRSCATGRRATKDCTAALSPAAPPPPAGARSAAGARPALLPRGCAARGAPLSLPDTVTVTLDSLSLYGDALRAQTFWGVESEVDKTAVQMSAGIHRACAACSSVRECLCELDVLGVCVASCYSVYACGIR